MHRYNTAMSWDTNTWLAVSAGATFLLAIAAFWAIWQNYRFRKQDRELNIKSQALDEICDWVNETFQLMDLSYSPDEGKKREARMRFQLVGVTGASMIVAAAIFGSEMVEKVKVALKSIEKFNVVLWSEGKVKDKALFIELWDSLFEVLKVAYNHKIELLPSTKDYKKK